MGDFIRKHRELLKMKNEDEEAAEEDEQARVLGVNPTSELQRQPEQPTDS